MITDLIYFLNNINNIFTKDIINYYYKNNSNILNFKDFLYHFKIGKKIKTLLFKLNNIRKQWLKKYIYTINHKRIAINYLYLSFLTGLSGAFLALMIRLELAYPGSPFFEGDSLRYLQVITAHGLIMVFFVVVPLIFGLFANLLIPYHVGSKDVAFPRLNSIGFWIQPCGFILVGRIGFLNKDNWQYFDSYDNFQLVREYKLYKSNYKNILDNSLFTNSFFNTKQYNNYFFIWNEKLNATNTFINNYFFIPFKSYYLNEVVLYPESFWYIARKFIGNKVQKIEQQKNSNSAATTAGWTFITPFSSDIKYTAIGSQDIIIISVIAAGVSSTISFTNLLITRRTMSAPGLRHRRILLPFFSIATLLSLRMLALITPVLGASMIMMALDRHWHTSFFDFAYGGDPILAQHLFWFFGHPEVYVLIIPTFGFINSAIPYYNTRRTASKHHMIWAVYVMSYMGFLVWGHHMYLIGLDHRSRSIYSTITIMISLPASVKLVNWTLSMINGALKYDVVTFFILSYVLFFIIGGFTGMWLSHVALNMSMHDSFYVVAHFHVMLSGVVMTGIFVGIYFYFYCIFGIRYSRVFAYLNFVYYVGGQWVTIIPQFYTGCAGMPRRIHDYPMAFCGWQSLSSSGYWIVLFGVFFFFLMLLDSHLEGRVDTVLNLGIPRWNKRVVYYLFKIRHLNYIKKKINIIPNQSINNLIHSNFNNEFEYYNIININSN